MNTISQSIEAILLATAEPQTYKNLARLLSVSEEEVVDTITELKTSLEGHGIVLLEQNDTVTLATRAEQSALIESIRKEELQKELSRASAETLAIIAYSPGISRAQIEFIRGVNVSYTLRTLSMRGLIEQKGSGRAIGYYPTLELLHSFGIHDISGLPEYEATKAKVDMLLKGELAA